ncbi:hypothetical protein GGP41_001491 [Bipolaris sorokiniana]|uniref:Uncharacterized protein n=1 Tax=Cochliobolus sativus TaxID=45130 RepID=A0A8H5ZLQ2_COCSA|nr:hypothetical protein GGP41_001491 [Bipolaris sorokiniana]
MLRLRPSELALTPDDVDETFGRISLKQTSTARQHWAMRPHGQPGRPILRRGPQRAIRDAITAFGDIPTLQPQQAVFDSVNEEEHVHNQQPTEPPGHDNMHTALPHHMPEGNDEAVPAVSPASRTMQLPFRPRPDRQALDTHVTSDEQGESASHPTPNPLPGPATSGPTGTIDSSNGQSARLPSADFVGNTPGLRGGGSLAGIAHGRHGRRDIIREHSPLHQVQKLASPAQQVSPGDPTKSPTNPSSKNSTLRSNGYLTQTPRQTYCHSQKRLPNSEPRRSSGPQPAITRSLSSGATPLSSVTCPSIPSDDVFGTPAVPEYSTRCHRDSYSLTSNDHSTLDPRNFSSTVGGVRQSDHKSVRPRERGSDATSANTGYSWYGSFSSDTRFPSSEHSQDGASPSPQLDGVRTRSHGPSPLPSMPYTRMQSDATSPSPISDGSRQISGGHVEAATAAVHDLQSPLDPYAEHYQRRVHTQHALLNYPTYANPAHPSLSTRGNSPTFLRPIQSLRMEQRSSENAPVSVPVNHGDAARYGRVPAHRAAYQRLQSPPYTTYSGAIGGSEMSSSRYSALPPVAPHDASNRSRDYTAHGSATTGMPRGGDVSRSASALHMHPLQHEFQMQSHHVVEAEAPRSSPRQPSGQYRAEFASHAPVRMYRSGSSSLSLQPRRDGPLSALASFEQGSGTTSRYTQSSLIRATAAATGRTYRRIRPEQCDQENNGDGMVMRREEANVAARYGDEEQHRTMMNETPPRIGRVERRMME